MAQNRDRNRNRNRNRNRYLVIHTPVDLDDRTVHPPSRMVELARSHGHDGAEPRWLRAWSPDVHDDRVFSLWDAEDAAAIGRVLDEYGLLSNMTAQALRVQEWGPEAILAAEAERD